MLHELLCGQHPFSGGTEFQLMQQHVSQRPRPLRELRGDVPQELQEVGDILARLRLASDPGPAREVR